MTHNKMNIKCMNHEERTLFGNIDAAFQDISREAKALEQLGFL